MRHSAIIVFVMLFTSRIVFAGGLLGDAINVIAPGVGTQLDKAHDQIKQQVPVYKQVEEGVSGSVRHGTSEIAAQTGGAALEQWLSGSRNTAIGTSQPIPPQIRQALTGYIENDILNRARFKVGDNGILNLAGLSIAYGDRIYGHEVQAVTLIDLIVFRNEWDAYNNPALWAHELTHVKQFRDWGTHDFSIRYARNSNGVEEPAYAVGNNYDAWKTNQIAYQTRSSQPQYQQVYNPQQQMPVPVQQNGSVCVTQANSCQWFGPVGWNCMCASPWGLQSGVIR